MSVTGLVVAPGVASVAFVVAAVACIVVEGVASHPLDRPTGWSLASILCLAAGWIFCVPVVWIAVTVTTS